MGLLRWSSFSPHTSFKSWVTMLCWQSLSGNNYLIDGLSLPLIGLILTSSIIGVGSELSMTLATLARLHRTTFTRPVLDPACGVLGSLLHTDLRWPIFPHLWHVASLAQHWPIGCLYPHMPHLESLSFDWSLGLPPDLFLSSDLFCHSLALPSVGRSFCLGEPYNA